MSKREAVVLVSRAMAVIEAVAAFLEMSYLPGRLVSFLQSLEILRLQGNPLPRTYFAHIVTASSVDLAFLVLRIGVLLVLALLFWKCGPAVERFLAPRLEDAQESAEPA